MPTIDTTTPAQVEKLREIATAYTDGVLAGVVAERGLRVQVMTGRYHSPNGGITAHVDTLTIVGIVDETRPLDASRQRNHREPVPAIWRVFEPRDDAPAALLVKRRIGDVVWSIVPADRYATDGAMVQWYMASGAVANGDSRFTELTGVHGAVNVHDRQEAGDRW